jgi:hypothetical protein
MKKGQKIIVNMGYGLKVKSTILETDSGYPLYSKNYSKCEGFGDPVSNEIIEPIK